MIIPKIEVKITMKGATTDDLYTIERSSDLADVCRKVFNADNILWQEEFIILCLNQANRVIGVRKLSSGGISGTVADPRMILLTAINCQASSIVLAHNHPSGNLKPSRADELLTQKIKEACKFFDIKVLDHVIITDTGYMSFADEGIL